MLCLSGTEGFTLTVGGEIKSQGTVLFVQPKHFSFADPGLEAVIEEEEDRFVITVKSKAYAWFVELDYKDTDAVFSDNCFDMPGGAARTVTVVKKDLSSSSTEEELRGQLSLRSVFDI